MSVLLSAHELGHTFASRPLFSGVAVTVADGDRVGLIGPNGAGKSTLLRILSGALAPDSGTVARRAGLRIAMVSQTPRFAAGLSVREAVASGLHASRDWEAQARVDEMLARLELVAPHAGPDALVDTLSGGWQKRVALAQALVDEPDLLLLDEPTNHLDIESILWLERFLAAAAFATITITHDRQFLQNVAKRIWELDRRNAGGLLDVAGDYATFLDRKEEAMAAQERQEETLRNTLRRELEWLRRGPAARTTKQKARIDRAGALVEEVNELGTRNRVGAVNLDFEATGKTPRRLIEARGIAKDYGAGPVFEDIDLFIGPGTRMGILGRNGCGKSTLLRVLLGQEPPTRGQVLRADDLTVATFAQDRGSLDPERTLADTVCPDGDYVDYRGKRMHRHGYLARFLFTPEQMNVKVGKLSGGEQARILVSTLMLRPANLLVLDEPTNDLDIPTLNVLEEALLGFEGAVLLVSHDRAFVDRVSNRLLGFHDGHGGTAAGITEFADLAQWQSWQDERRRAARGSRGSTRDDGPRGEPGRKRIKLSYKDQRDLDTIEARIEAAEARLSSVQAQFADPAVVSNGEKILALQQELAQAEREVEALYERWQELERLVQSQTGPPSGASGR